MLPKAVRMLRRAEFVQASRIARVAAAPCFVVQSVPDSAPNLARHAKDSSRLRRTTASSGSTPDITLGITASRKIGKAVARNRAKRRLRALLYQVLMKDGTPSPSRRLVLIARKACLDTDFSTMRQQLEQILTRNKAQRP